MKIFALLFVVGFFAVLSKVVLIIQEALRMNFDFSRPWFDDDVQLELVKPLKVPGPLNDLGSRPLEKLESPFLYQE